jgi:predicted transcriptional regulator
MEVSIPTSAQNEPTWRFLTNHGNTLLYIARDPDARARDIAEHVGITERAAQRIIAELIAEGYIEKTKNGRRNHYTINRHGHLRHPAFQDIEIGAVIDVFHNDHESHAENAGAAAAAVGRGTAAPPYP